MEEFNETPSTCSKMDQQDLTPDTVNDFEDTQKINLPEQLQKIVPAEEFVSVRHRWNTNEEIASILIAFDRHKEWLVLPQKIRPASGSMLLYNRKQVFYRRDGYCWKKRKNGSTIREDHMKLKVQGLENPNIVLIHYLNVPYPESAKPSIPFLSAELRQKDWSKEELVDQLRPMLCQVTQGTEHDVEEDQKVEKLLEEILPLLMPMQDNNKTGQNFPRISQVIAPVPSTTSHLSVFDSTTSSSSKRPVRKQLRTDEPLGSMDQQSQTKGIVSLLQHHQLQPLQQLPNGQMSGLQPLNGPGFMQQNSQPALLINATQGQQHYSNNQILQDSGRNANPCLEKNMADYLCHSLGGAGGSSGFVTIGSGVIMTSTSAPAAGQSRVTNSGYPGAPTSLVQSLSPLISNHCEGVSNSTAYTSLAQSSTSNVLANAKESRSSIPMNNLSDQEQVISGAPYQIQYFSQQQQQQHHLYQIIAQQNHSSQQDHSDSAQIQQTSQPQVPVLTLHLKPANVSSSETPGFFLSLQGATIVSQHCDQTGLAGFTTNTTPSLNFSNNQGVVLVASQNPSTGSLLLNPVPTSSQPITSSSTSLSSFTAQHMMAQNAPANQCPLPFPTITAASPMTGSLFTQPGDSGQLPTFSSYSLSHARQNDDKVTNNAFFSTPPTKTFPTYSDYVPVNNASILQFPSHIPESKDTIKPDPQVLSFDSVRENLPVPNYISNPTISSQTPLGFTQTLSQHSSESRPVFGLQPSMLGPHHPQPVGEAPQQFDATELMAAPLSLGSTVKDMITNPNSCDMLDGSFSSLPSADLNLDDLLDLNDLDDVSDLRCSPFTPTDMVLGAVGVDVCNKGCSSGLNMAGQGQNAVPGTLSPFSCVENPLVSQNLNVGQQPPLQPGSGVQLPASYEGMMVSPSPSQPQLSCDITMNNLGGSHASDPELNSVIKDFSPDWAYTKTSTKILVAGPWMSEDASYTCVFDGEHIPALLLQPGLLRCFTQYHPPGFATLQVARNGVIISNLEVFEFCDKEHRDNSSCHPEWFAIDSNQLKLLLVERLDHLYRHFARSSSLFQDVVSDDDEVLESALVQKVKSLSNQQSTYSNLYLKAGQHHLTLLHLAAALGYAKFIACLIRWRIENSCVALEFEIDAQSVDSHSCTPLMWACALGQIDAALTLYHWNASPLKMCNKDGLLPLALARQKGHYNLANQVEQLERAKELLLKEQQQCSTSGQRMDTTCSPAATHTLSRGPDFRPLDEEKKEDSELKDELIVPPASFSKPGKPGPKLIRRYSEQVISQQTRTLSKRNSIDILPSGQEIDQGIIPCLGSPLSHAVRETNSEPHLPVSPDMAFVAPPAPRLLLEDEIDEPSGYSGEMSTTKMDTDDICARGTSPIIDVERISSDDEIDANKDGSKHQMVTLANQIIAAIPERIKLSPPKGDDVDDASSGRGRSESHSSLPSQGSPRPSSFGDDSGISTPMTDSLAFEEYRYPEFGTPASSLSPDSTCLPSPYSPYSFTLDSPPPTTAEFTEYFNAPTTYMEKDFSQLTLSDQEQRKLYEAAKVIQNAYRHYRDKQQQQQQQLQQQKEIEAAILIQSYYRRYKTYAYYKKMSHAAVLIQNQFRTYYAKRKKRGDTGATPRRESERLKKGRNQSVIIQQRFRSHYQRRSLDGKEANGQASGSGDAPDSSPPPHKGNFQDESSEVEGESAAGGQAPVSLDASETKGRKVVKEHISGGGDTVGQVRGEADLPDRTDKGGEKLGERNQQENLVDSGCVADNDEECGIFKME